VNRKTKITNFILGTIGRADIAPNIPADVNAPVTCHPTVTELKGLLIFFLGFIATSFLKVSPVFVSLLDDKTPGKNLKSLFGWTKNYWERY